MDGEIVGMFVGDILDEVDRRIDGALVILLVCDILTELDGRMDGEFLFHLAMMGF